MIIMHPLPKMLPTLESQPLRCFWFGFFIISVMVLSLAHSGWAFKCIISLLNFVCCLFAAEEMEVEVGVWCGCYRFLSLPFLYFFIKVAGSERIKKHETDLMLIPSHEKQDFSIL